MSRPSPGRTCRPWLPNCSQPRPTLSSAPNSPWSTSRRPSSRWRPDLSPATSLTLRTTIVLAGMATGGIDRVAAQDSVAQFYRGKTINFVIGANIGGGNDAYARLVARHIGSHIRGTPLVVAKNMPGAGRNKAAAYLYSQAAKDGTAIGAIQPGAILQPLLSGQKATHDPSKINF